ncbi:MAG TPA: EAL domain-containing protein [Solirubrobacteraceae bacterium]|nr:EAL domain-containing protein [Solirubrobacteraceae bacterium]
MHLLRRHLPTGRTLPAAEWDRRHSGILVVLWTLALALPLYGLAGGHALAHDTIGGISLLAIALLASRARRRHATSSALASLGLCTASALAVHLANGAIEAHFMFFVAIIVVSLYEDWRPFLIAFAFVVVHHGAMGVIDHGSVYSHPGNPWLMAAVHGAFVLAASIAAVVSWRMNEDVRAESRRANEHATASDARFRSAFEDGPVGMALIAAAGPARGSLVRVNRTLCQRLGYGEDELAGAPVSALLDEAGEARIFAAIDELTDGRLKVYHDELALLDRAGRPFDGRLSMSLVGGPHGALDVIVQIEDVTERNRLERQLQALADLDPLTGLFNRRRFELELWTRLDRGARSGAVVLIDLDNFKEVNDTLSHQAGDELLSAVAAALTDRTRSGDVVARLGGDEFAVLVEDVTPEEAGMVGGALVERVAQWAVHGVGTGARRTTASVGVVAYAAGTPMSGDQLLNDADLAMYEAKDAGGNRCVLYSAEQATAGPPVDRISWPERIRRALDEERLALYAQPILDVRTRKVAHYELLLRMLGPDGEVILPGAFLPVAERRGMIRAIDRWVVREAIALLEHRPEDAEPIGLQLNISARSLSDDDFLDYVFAALDRSQIDPAALVFEVTETAAIASLADACRFLTALSERGCGIALDDFGSGFASFQYLKNLPFDELKIDGQFIKNLTTSPDDLVLVETLQRLAGSMGKRTVAEYVEDAATLQLVRDVGIDYAQGWYVGRPAPAQELIGRAASESRI